MNNWTYKVIVKTDAGTSVADSVEKLSRAQESASSIFQAMSEKLDGEKLIENIIKGFQSRLGEIKKEDPKNKDEDLKKDLDEIKTALLVIMDVKEGNLHNVLQAFENAEEIMTRGEDSLKNVLKSSYDLFEKQFQERSDKALDGLIDIYRTITPTFGEKDESFFDIDPSSPEFFTKRFLSKKIGTIESLMESLPSFASENFLDDFKKFTSQVGNTDEDFQKLSEGEFDPWTTIKDAFSTKVSMTKKMNDYIGDKRQNPYAGYRRKLESADEVLTSEELGIWDRLEKNFGENLQKTMQKSGSDLFADSIVQDLIIKDVLPNVFSNLRESMFEDLKENPERTPSLAVKLRSELNNEENFPIEKISDYLQNIGSKLNMESIQKKIQEAFKSTQEKVLASGRQDPEFFSLRLDKQLEDVPEILREPLKKFMLQELLGEEAEIRKQGTQYGKDQLASNKGEEHIMTLEEFISLFSQSYEDISLYFERYRKEHDPEFKTEELSKETKDVSNSVFDFEGYFMQAQTDRDYNFNMINDRLNIILENLQQNRNDLGQKLNMTLSQISNIKIPMPEKQDAATPSGIRPTNIGGMIL